jgi:hypothetical protein
MISKQTILLADRFQLRIPDDRDVDFVFSESRYPGFNDGTQRELPTEKEVNPRVAGTMPSTLGKGGRIHVYRG